MKKLILKTALITLLCIVVVVGAIFGFLVWLSPKTLASVFDKLGNYAFSVSMYEREYNNTKNLSDLSVLVIKLNQNIDGEKTEKYSLLMITDVNYIDYVKTTGKVEFYTELSAHEYYYGKAVSSMMQNDKFEDAIFYADKFVDEFGYSEHNPYRIIISSELNSLSISEKLEISQNLQSYISSATSEELVRINKDASLLTNS